MPGIDVIKKGLARKIGPMANIILEEHASKLGEKLDSFPEERIPQLLLSLRGEPDILEEVEAMVGDLSLEKAPPAPPRLLGVIAGKTGRCGFGQALQRP